MQRNQIRDRILSNLRRPKAASQDASRKAPAVSRRTRTVTLYS